MKFLKDEFNLIQLTKIVMGVYFSIMVYLIWKKL